MSQPVAGTTAEQPANHSACRRSVLCSALYCQGPSRANALHRLARRRCALDRVHRPRASGSEAAPATPRLTIDPIGNRFRSTAPGTAATTPAPGRRCADLTDFDQKNHWLIDRGDGRAVGQSRRPELRPSATSCSSRRPTPQTLNGIPRGMTPAIVNYFKSRGIRVMLSIGGITYIDAWNQALAENATQLGQKAAAGRQAARRRHRDRLRGEHARRTSPACRRSSTPTAPRIPYDATGANPAARLTIDLAAGDRWLIDLDQQGDRATGSRPTRRCSTTPTPWCRQAADARAAANVELAGAHRRQTAVRPADPAARAGKVHRQRVPRRRRQGPSGVRQLAKSLQAQREATCRA